VRRDVKVTPVRLEMRDSVEQLVHLEVPVIPAKWEFVELPG